jgi:tetratricopeptide (TPR) repeat protein
MREVPLKTLLELARFEKETAVEQLLARAEFVELQRLTRGAQRNRVIQSRSCHTSSFLRVLLAALRSPRPRDESEFLSALVVLAAQSTDFANDSVKNDVLAAIWIETANARRIYGDLIHAQAVLSRAQEHLAAGTGAPSIKERWLSIAASLLTDCGERAEASAYLEQCLSLQERRNDWPLVARTLVKMAHSLVDDHPERALSLLDRARVLSPAEEIGLNWLLESIRTECLVTLGQVEEALRGFERAEALRPLQRRPNARLRSAFTAARLLECLGRMQEAEVLFDEVVAGDLEQGLYKDALLDLLYVFGFHVRLGSPERAADLSRRTLREIERQDYVVHEQLQSVWEKLIEVARGCSLDDRVLAQARRYLGSHWKHPAPTEPTFESQERGTISPVQSAVPANEKLVAALLARARWALIRRMARREQHLQVDQSTACHTRAFVEVLLAEIGAAESRDASEFVASLALTAAKAMIEPAAIKHDLQGQIWTEVANARRIGAEWSRALVALRRASDHLAQGSGDLLLAARVRSVEASLRADQGHRAEAVVLLDRCQKLYEALGVWHLVARTLVQMAHGLVDTEPERGLALVDKALPLIPAADSVLRWLAESIRTECLIERNEVGPALQAFHLAESFREKNPREDAARRSNFTAARLLEALGHVRQAERLFDGVIADAFEHEAYREGFLDLLYLFSFHVRLGAAQKAMTLCRFALAQLQRFEIGHEQLRAVWMELSEATSKRAVTLEALAEVREYLLAHWRAPAAKTPKFSFGQGLS